jgi:RimJ/RimL family protein N-acetyltransferase
MHAALTWADAALGYPAMFCVLAPANTASIRVAEKSGFKPWFDTTRHDHPTAVLRRPSQAV